MSDKDIVADILSHVEKALRGLAHDQGFEQSMVDAMVHTVRAQDKQVRNRWARSEPYVPARPPERKDAQRQALEDAKKSGNVAAASSRFGVSRATIYRLLKRG